MPGDFGIVLQWTLGVNLIELIEQIRTLVPASWNDAWHLSFVALRKARVVNEKEVKPDIAKVVREQLNRSAYKHALRSRYKPIAGEPMTDDLLKQLAEKEEKQQSDN